MALGGGNNDRIMEAKWQEVISNFYEMFDKKIEKEIILMVVQNSGNQNAAYMHLQSMLDDMNQASNAAFAAHGTDETDPVPVATVVAATLPENAQAVEPNPAASSTSIVANDTLYDELDAEGVAMLQRKPTKPENLLEQLSMASVPPADINLVMSSTPASSVASLLQHQDPAIVRSFPASPGRGFSLFDVPPVPPVTSFSPPIQSNPRNTEDSLFGSNPYFDQQQLIFSQPSMSSVVAAASSQPLVSPTKKDTEPTTEKSIDEKVNDPNRHTLVLMRGLPGSGKSFRAQQLCGVLGVILSTDDYFLRNGTYTFDYNLLQHAHLWNQDRAKQAVEAGTSPVIIDNTNMQLWEMKPYIQMALKHNYVVEVVEPDTWWAWKPGHLARINTHGVPKSKIENMKERYEKFHSIESILNSKHHPAHAAAAAADLADPREIPIQGKALSRPCTRSQSKKEEEGQQPQKPPEKMQGRQKPQRRQQQKDVIASNEDIIEIDSEPVSKPPVAAGSECESHLVATSTPTKPMDLCQKRLFSAHNNSLTENDNFTDRNQIVCSDAALLQLSNIKQKGNVDNREENIDLNMLSLENDHVSDRSVEVMDITCEDGPLVLKITGGKQTAGDTPEHYTDPPPISRHNSPEDVNLPGTGALLSNADDPSLTNSSSGNIVDLVNQLDKDLIDLTGGESGQDEAKMNFDFNLQFISECFPNFKPSYCRNWLQRYNGDLVKTCDYLSRCSQTEELPVNPDVPNIDDLLPKHKSPSITLEDIFENTMINNAVQPESVIRSPFVSHQVPRDVLCDRDEEGDKTNVLAPPATPLEDAAREEPETEEDPLATFNYRGTQTDCEAILIPEDDAHRDTHQQQPQLQQDQNEKQQQQGEMFFCEGLSSNSPGKSEDGGICIAIDAKLAMELSKMFGKPTGRELLPGDFVISLKRDVAKEIHRSWLESIARRKDELQTRLREDEELAKQLQDEDLRILAEEEVKRDAIDSSPGKKKKARNKSKKKDTPFSSSPEDQRIYGGSFQPLNPAWNKENQMTVSGRQMQLRKELYGKFPGVGEDALDNILEVCGYNLPSAISIVQNACGLRENPTVKHVYASPETTGVNQQFSSPPRKKPHTNFMADAPGPSTAPQPRVDPMPRVSPLRPQQTSPDAAPAPPASLYQTMTESNQTYQDFRREAQVHKEMRTQYFQRAAEAFQAKNGAVAQHYADKAKEHTRLMNEAHARAAELTLAVTNRPYLADARCIDFHGLHPDEALRALNNFLETAWKLNRYTSVYVITGRGNHSKSGISVIRKVVLDNLTSRGLRTKLHSAGGMIEVFLR